MLKANIYMVKNRQKDPKRQKQRDSNRIGLESSKADCFNLSLRSNSNEISERFVKNLSSKQPQWTTFPVGGNQSTWRKTFGSALTNSFSISVMVPFKPSC